MDTKAQIIGIVGNEFNKSNVVSFSRSHPFGLGSALDFKPKWLSVMEQMFGRGADLLPNWEMAQAVMRDPQTLAQLKEESALFSTWFFKGLQYLKVTSFPGIDAKEALSHIRAVMFSTDCKHEHKETGVAILFGTWFERIEYQQGKVIPPMFLL